MNPKQEDIDWDSFIKWTQTQHGSATFEQLRLIEAAFRAGLELGRTERKK